MDTNEELTRHVESTRDSVERLFALSQSDDSERTADDLAFLVSQGAADDVEAEGSSDVAADLLAESPLEIVGTWRGSWKGDALYHGCEVVFCSGGPHIELDTTADLWVGYWGGETVKRDADQALCDFYDLGFES
jgi:hypothetical protein